MICSLRDAYCVTEVTAEIPLRGLRIALPVQGLSMNQVSFDLKPVHKPSEGSGR
jgi:hypothetical protein